MKKLSLWTLLVLMTVLVACNKDDDEQSVSNYTAENVEGEWLWTVKNSDIMDSDEISYTSYQDGKIQYREIVNGKWEMGESTYTFENDVFIESRENKKYNVIYADFTTLIFEEQSTNIRYAAQKVHTTTIDPMMVGAWYSEAIDATAIFNEDGTCSYEYNGDFDEETFGVYNDFYWYEKEDHSGSFVHFLIEMGEMGTEMIQTWVDGSTIHTEVFVKELPVK